MHIESLVSEGVIDLDGYIQTNACKCPSCGKSANYRFYDSCNGGCINQQRETNCPSCGYHSCDDECCRTCEEIANTELSLSIGKSLGVTNSYLAIHFLARIETDLMVILAKVKIDSSGTAVSDDMSHGFINDILDAASLICSFDYTEYSDHALSREVLCSIHDLFNELNNIIQWSDSF